MQLLGFAILFGVIWYGFTDRSGAVISAFDPHAFVMVVCGCFSAIMVSSSPRDTLMTFISLGEFVPGVRRFAKLTKRIETDREQLVRLWREGRRSAASEIAEKSSATAVKKTLELILGRTGPAVSANTFLELRHQEIAHWQPAILNWEMLSKLGPSFGMVGTITGMVQLFRNMGSADTNIGSAMSLALLATLYGVAFGAGIAGPISHYLNGLLDDRLGCIERCEKSVNEIVSRAEF